MASANDSSNPPDATGIQATPPQGNSMAIQPLPSAPEAATIPLPPPRPKRAPLRPEQVAAWIRPLDAILAVVMFVLAFFLASFAARNSDLLLHLASGRGLLDGTYKFGQDPFSYTTEGVRWVNHAWLYDVCVYLLYQSVQGPGLIVAKAILVTLLAWVVLAMRRQGQSLWIPAVCSTIAMLAVSQRMLLHSAILSYLLLGVTLWLLQLPSANSEETSARGSKRNPKTENRRFDRRWLLPLLFLLWVNLDGWFLLGPVTVALYWVGQLIQDFLGPVREGPDRRGTGDNRTLGLALLVGLAACLINPHHIYAFTLPAQLSDSGAAAVLQYDPRFSAMFWTAIDFYNSGAGWSAAGIAYLVLLGLSVFSFAANYQDWRGWRILIWGAFASLSIYNARTVPFFAIVAGPITALNFQDAVARHFGTTPRVTVNWRQWSIAGRIGTVFLGVLLVALAWPGWLHTAVGRAESTSQRVAWRLDFEPSLVKAAQQLQEWHKQGLLTESDRGLNFAPDVAYYCAWFAPAEKTFIDRRVTIFDKAAPDLVAANKALEIDPEAAQNFTTKLEPLTRVLRQRGINHLVFFSPEPSGSYEALVQFENDYSSQWTLVYRDGRTTIFSWDDPQKKGQRNRLTQEYLKDDRLAFGTDAEPVPAERPRPPEPRAWYERFLHPREARSLSTDEAGMHLLYFQAIRPQYEQRGLNAFLNAEAAGLVASAASAPLAGEPYFRAIVADTCFEATNRQLLGARANKPRPRPIPDLSIGLLRNFVENKVPGPMAPPLLAIRACRRALAENADDAETYFRLQSAYAVMTKATKERELLTRLPLLASIRQVQRIAALNHAVNLNPDFELAHAELAGLYEQLGYFDLVLKHLTEQLRLTRERGPGRREKPEDYDKAIKRLEDTLERLDAAVTKAQNDYEVQQVNRPSLRQKAELALQKGLGGLARDTLVQLLDPRVEPSAIPLQLNLMVLTGAIEGETGIRLGLDNAKDYFEDRGEKPNLGPIGEGRTILPFYEWLQVMVAAASGDYRAADSNLEPIVTLREQSHRDATRAALRGAANKMLLDGLRDMQPSLLALWRALERQFLLDTMKAAAATQPYTADIHAIRAILALEAGENARAETHFRKVLELKDANLAPLASYYLDLLEKNR